MQSRKDGNGYVLILDKGEEIVFTIGAWAKREKISGAHISGIGSVASLELGAYDPATKFYKRAQFDGQYELLSLQGNITDAGLHAHVVICGQDYAAHGGHLFSGVVLVTGEFFATPFSPLEKVAIDGTRFKKIALDG